MTRKETRIASRPNMMLRFFSISSPNGGKWKQPQWAYRHGGSPTTKARPGPDKKHRRRGPSKGASRRREQRKRRSAKALRLARYRKHRMWVKIVRAMKVLISLEDCDSFELTEADEAEFRDAIKDEVTWCRMQELEDSILSGG